MTEQPTRKNLASDGGDPTSSGPVAATTGGLKLVTMAPGSSIADAHVADFQPGESAPPPGRSDPYIGYTIDGRYKVEAVLGEGGMGVVYRCTHKIIGKKVAMKVLRADLARDTEVTERFLNEAKSASAIGNPHIIDISDFGQLPDGSTYFIMEFLDGVALASVIDRANSIPITRIIHVARQLAEGLSAAHASGIVHRDLKPDNIFLVGRGSDKDFVKILDFGIAKVSHGEGKLTRAGAVFGTPHYMSPEQAAGAPVDHRGDIYSFGVILYEMASGKVPFDADNFMGILTQHMYKAPVPIRALVPQPQDVPPGLEAVVLKCLSKRPEQRYQSMDEIVAELDKLADGLVPDAVPEMMARSGGFNVPADYFKKGARMPAPVPATPAGVPSMRSRWPLISGVVGVCLAIGIVIAIFAKSADSTASPPATPSAAVAADPPKPEPVAAPTPSAAEPAAPAVAKHQVAIAIEPSDAHAFLGDKDLGASPVLLDIDDGSKMSVELRRDGYKSATLDLDGSQPRVLKKLTRLPGAVAARPAPAAKPEPKPKPKPKPKPQPAIGGGEIVNPWAN